MQGLTIVKQHDVFGKLLKNKLFVIMSAVNEVKRNKEAVLRIFESILKALGNQ